MSGPVSSAVICETVSRITSILTGKYSEHNNVQKWIERLEYALVKIYSAIQESEEFDISIDDPLHKWQEKWKKAVSEAEEVLTNFHAEIHHEDPNQTVEGGSSAHDQSMQEEGHDDATLRLPASNLRETVPRQADLEANLPHDPFMQEEGSGDATLVHPGSHLRETATRQVDQEANLRHDPFLQEEGSDDATLVHPGSHLRETATRQVDQEANLPHDQPMQEEGSDDAILLHPASYLTETVSRQLDQEANLPHVQLMTEEGSDDATLVNPASNHRSLFHNIFNALTINIQAVVVGIFENLEHCPMICPYLENDKRVSKLKDTVEKLERMAGDIGDFIEMLKLQSKRNMCRKRKRSARPHRYQGFFLVLSVKLKTYVLFCYGEDPHLLVIKLFRANCNVPTKITSEIFIGFIMQRS